MSASDSIHQDYNSDFDWYFNRFNEYAVLNAETKDAETEDAETEDAVFNAETEDPESPCVFNTSENRESQYESPCVSDNRESQYVNYENNDAETVVPNDDAETVVPNDDAETVEFNYENDKTVVPNDDAEVRYDPVNAPAPNKRKVFDFSDDEPKKKKKFNEIFKCTENDMKVIDLTKDTENNRSQQKKVVINLTKDTNIESISICIFFK